MNIEFSSFLVCFPVFWKTASSSFLGGCIKHPQKTGKLQKTANTGQKTEIGLLSMGGMPPYTEQTRERG